jgi:hypothetical protein
MLSSFGVSESLGKSEINDIDVVLFLADPNQEVVRLNVSVEEVARVNEFYSLQLLNSVREGWLPFSQQA